MRPKTRSEEVWRLTKWARVGGLIAPVLLVVIQFVPYGRAHTRPPVRQEPAWDLPATRDLTRRACFDCHSNETPWPWYADVAPLSWLIQSDVDGGRRRLNFSEWDRTQRAAGRASRTVRRDTMPPWYYLPWHAQARLTDAERQALIRGLERILGVGSP
jgi:mono/diheme cytochrome c family protein